MYDEVRSRITGNLISTRLVDLQYLKPSTSLMLCKDFPFLQSSLYPYRGPYYTFSAISTFFQRDKPHLKQPQNFKHAFYPPSPHLPRPSHHWRPRHLGRRQSTILHPLELQRNPLNLQPRSSHNTHPNQQHQQQKQQ